MGSKLLITLNYERQLLPELACPPNGWVEGITLCLNQNFILSFDFAQDKLAQEVKFWPFYNSRSLLKLGI